MKLTGSGDGSISCVGISASNLEPSKYVKFDLGFNEVFKALVALIFVDRVLIFSYVHKTTHTQHDVCMDTHSMRSF